MIKITWETIVNNVLGTPKTIASPAPVPHKPMVVNTVTKPPVAKPPVNVSVTVKTTNSTPAPASPNVASKESNPKNSTMNSDSYFVIGSTHDVCQDYVTHHNDGAKSYVVLADGCSGSKDSDVGARILVKTNELYIPNIGVMDFNEYTRKSSGIYSQVIEEARDNAKALDLDQMSLDATIMSIISNRHGEFLVSCYGDGVVVLGRKDGIIETYSVSYKEGYPNYLSYRICPDRKEKFKEKTGNYKEVTLEMIGGEEVLKQKYRSSTAFDVYLGKKEDYRWVAILSDGVHSFTEKSSDSLGVSQTPIEPSVIIKELFNFKNFNGTFVKRRVKRFLESCVEKNWSHGDDLSVGVVYLGDD